MTEDIIKGELSGEKVVSDSVTAKDLYSQSLFGEMKNGSVAYSLVEALYLVEKGKMIVKSNGKELNFDSFLKKVNKMEINFWTRYCVFKDMRTRGYIVKTALKYGAEFRVYDRGIKPGEDHAKWILFPVNEGSASSWYDLSAKNRVSHSTKKKLLIGIVDDEDEVTYLEFQWVRP